MLIRYRIFNQNRQYLGFRLIFKSTVIAGICSIPAGLGLVFLGLFWWGLVGRNTAVGAGPEGQCYYCLLPVSLCLQPAVQLLSATHSIRMFFSHAQGQVAIE